jgi:hypothetical protein
VQPDGWAELSVFVQDRITTRRSTATGRASAVAMPEPKTKMISIIVAASVVLMLSLQSKEPDRMILICVKQECRTV